MGSGGEGRRVAVVGQGVIGMTSASRLVDRGYDVTLFSREPFAATTSMAAGAYWWPHKVYPEAKVARWAQESYQEYQRLRQDPAAGILFQEHYRFCVDPDTNAYARFLIEDWESIVGADHGFPCSDSFRMTLPVIDVPIFMRGLRNRLEERNCQFLLREVASPGELFPEFDLVINCTGVWARHFVADPEVYPIRGQAVRVSLPAGLKVSTRLYREEDHFTLILPRTEDVILGGTAGDGDWDRTPRQQDTDAMFERCCEVVPQIRESTILGAAVGLRPGRREVRLELETVAGDRPVIHNYGHGGAGFTVGWGCASEVASLAEEYFRGRIDPAVSGVDSDTAHD